MLLFAIARLLPVVTTAAAGPSPLPLLFMDLLDTSQPDNYGLLVPTASTATHDPAVRPPPSLDYSAGVINFAVLPSLSISGSWEAYSANATGWEPREPQSARAALERPGHPGQPPPDPQWQGLSLVRSITTDFWSWSEPEVVGNWPDCTEGATALKSMARDDTTGRYVLFAAELNPKAGYTTLVSSDAGMSWISTKCTKHKGCIEHPDKDDLNIIFNNGRFVDMQITWRNHTMRYCDSDPCNTRRVVSAKTSADGVNWGPDLGVIAPDPVLDPPDLEFYRTRPFYVGNTTRIVAHTLQYAPGPPMSVVGPTYGRQPLKCKPTATLGMLCHGPHIQEEWWIGPASGDPANLTGWRRPFKSTPAAPRDAFLMAQPATLNDKHVWIGSNYTGYSLPLHRIAGLYSRSNGEIVTDEIVVPASPLTLNAAAKWSGRALPTGGCDEGCAAYVYVELIDPATRVAVPGFDRHAFRVLLDVDSIALPLKWGNQSASVTSSAGLAGRTVRARIGFRDAVIYALGGG